MAKKVKLYEIAKAIGIGSAELLEVCRRAGYAELTHHSKAVSPEEAEEIRKTAIKLYRPKESAAEPAAPKPAPQKKATPKKAPPRARKVLPPTADVKPVPPPKPTGTRRAAAEARPQPAGLAAEAGEKTSVRRRPPRRPPKGEETRKRTIIFKQPKRHVEKKRIEKAALTRPVSVRDLAEGIGVPASQILKELMFEHGVRASINEVIDDELVLLIGVTHDVEVELSDPRTAEDSLLESLPDDAPEDLRPRPPIVALLGHVDHGKTSILDRIRNTRVVDTEAGGITQDTGAWQVEIHGHLITFIDTPGHEAFTAMRARGAQLTDIVVLVVAADDGVMPQTTEAINHARDAGVPIVVAVNKIDRPEANPMRVRQQLAGQELNPEEWGGEVGVVDVSAITGEGIDDLLERIILEAELLELKANPDRPANGAVLEARMEPGRGVVANVVVLRGTLHVGDIIVCGGAYGTVRSIVTPRRDKADEAAPSEPVAISGLSSVPEAGDTFVVVSDLETARKVAQERANRLQQLRRRPRRHVTLETLFDSLERGHLKQLNVVLKADVQGTLEPLIGSLARLGNEEVSVRIVHSGIGNVNPSDVVLADAADAVIIAFRVHADEKVRDMASMHGIEIVHYDVIYNVTEQIRAALEGLLEPERREEHIGTAEVRRVFRISRFGSVAGCVVRDGAIRRNCRIRVVRDGEVLHEGALSSLRQEKNDVRVVETGRECGINLERFNDIQEGDTIEAFTTVLVKRTLPANGSRASAPEESRTGAPPER